MLAYRRYCHQTRTPSVPISPGQVHLYRHALLRPQQDSIIQPGNNYLEGYVMTDTLPVKSVHIRTTYHGFTLSQSHRTSSENHPICFSDLPDHAIDRRGDVLSLPCSSHAASTCRPRNRAAKRPHCERSQLAQRNPVFGCAGVQLGYPPSALELVTHAQH
ncbi:hypothetical protein BKA93DRAFT_610327 [Sparassis latifolia]